MFNLRSLDLNLLTVFVAIYEVGGVSAAAGRLALSQSATSRALPRTREACKDDLFVRTSQGLSPTPVAQAMYPAIKQALEALRASLAEASGVDPAQSERHFRIQHSAPHGPVSRTKAASGSCGHRARRRANFRYGFLYRLTLKTTFRDGVVDLAIDWLPIELDPFVNRKLFDDRLVLVARGSHPPRLPAGHHNRGFGGKRHS